MRLFSLFLLVAACEASIFTSKDVRVLQGKDFKRLVTASDKLTLAAFIAPWCGYCKKLGPEFDAAASNLKGLVNLVAVDCDEAQNKQFCQEQGVKGFPTMKVFPGGSAPSKSYDGPRTAKGMVDSVIGDMPTFVKRATTVAALDELREKARTKPIALLFTSAATVSPMYKALSSTFHRSIDFYAAREATVGKEVMTKFGVQTLPSLVILQGDESILYPGALKLQAINDFLKPISNASKERAASIKAQKATGEL